MQFESPFEILSGICTPNGQLKRNSKGKQLGPQHINRSKHRSLRRLLIGSMATLLMGATAQAQTNVLSPGDAVVTGFSGIVQKEADPSLGRDILDRFFIDLDGPSAQFFALDIGASGAGDRLSRGTPKRKISASEVGQVFATALDDGLDGDTPNIYLGATSVYGINIVRPVAGGGNLRRIKRGQPGAQFMPGQFGPAEESPAGSIWRVDGKSGNVTLFATLPGNSGPGVGDIAFSSEHKQFYASDCPTSAPLEHSESIF